MGYTPQTKEEIGDNVAEALDWRFAERNDEAVAQALQAGEGIEAVYTADEAELLSGFFDFLGSSGVMAHWQTFTIAGVQRVFQPAIYFVLLYSTRVLLGIGSSNALPELLFSNLAVMSLIGFTAWQVRHGLSSRGEWRRGEGSPYFLMGPQTLAETISKASALELEKLFNGTIHCLAAFGVFMAEVMVVVDGTPVVTTPRYEGRGCQSVQKRGRTRRGVAVTIVELVFGFRLIALMDLMTLIPLAIKIVKIEAHEAPYLVGLVKQAQANLAPYSRISWLVVDRAYVDGKSLYELDQMDIYFVVIAKSNMLARQTALHLKGQVTYHDRLETRRYGYGHAQGQEKLLTRLYAVTHIRDWAAYRPPVEAGKRLRREARPTLNALVVELWRNQPPTPTGPRVYLTNAPLDHPWTLIDRYDDRSWVENGLFRNAKQFWHLTRWFPKKSLAAVRSHLTFVMMINALTTAYRLWQQALAGAPHQVSDLQIDAVSYRLIDPQTGEVIDLPTPVDPHPTHLASTLPLPTPDDPQAPNSHPPPDLLAHSLLAGQGILRWQRQVHQHCRDKVIVFIGPLYGIFTLYDFLVLLGVTFRHPPPHLDPPDAVLRRYGCDADPRASPA
jgi:hypothetical protein